ncbi:complex I subunit 5 family protein [Desulfovermiculus halophilus]|jgi:multicomponent Na+:H+ antiporter subunit D|uniref:complex I subunit 5 family protein n=1 Tax=Desulfovermiculus halophilus TaxID=339722 RepID=UPI000483CB12|nr:proton-conducting transporter membrane subunit [Desulfovermiculus halophilus]
MIAANYPALLVLSPLLAAFVNAALIWVDRRLCYPVTILGLAASALCAWKLLLQVLEEGAVSYWFGGWPPPMGIELYIDKLNILVLLVICVVSLVNIVASKRNIHAELGIKDATFYVIYLLFVTGILGVTATADLFNLYVLIEIASLASYGLLAMGNRDRAPWASLNYVFLGVIGASFYLLGVGYLYIMTGSLNMFDVHSLLPSIMGSSAIVVAFVFCLIGVWIKMALFPLHGWLPNAYAYAPVSASRIIAPLMTKVMIYVMIRLMLSVFGYQYVFEDLQLQSFVLILASVAILAGALLALAQQDLTKMLVYIIVCEVGYMVGGAWLGNANGMTGAILHIVNDALMTFALFLVLGNIAYVHKKTSFQDLRGIFGSMPWTMAGFVLAGVSIIGVPPTCGFFSKWYLIVGGIEAGAWIFVAALILSSLASAVLVFRVVEIAFFPAEDEEHGGHGHQEAVLNEAPLPMLGSLGLVGAGLIAVGVWSGFVVQKIIVPFVHQGMS